jgi:hypothetical protein
VLAADLSEEDWKTVGYAYELVLALSQTFDKRRARAELTNAARNTAQRATEGFHRAREALGLPPEGSSNR